MIQTIYKCDVCDKVCEPGNALRVHFVAGKRDAFELVHLGTVGASDRIVCVSCIHEIVTQWERVKPK